MKMGIGFSSGRKKERKKFSKKIASANVKSYGDFSLLFS
jgi:hypothetical protein